MVKKMKNQKQTTEEIHEKDALSLFELGLSAIAKRPAYKRMITEVRKEVVKTEYDDDGKEVSSTVEYAYSDIMRHTTFSNVMVKAIVSGMNDRNTNSIHVPSYLGKMCVYKTPTSEDFAFLKCRHVVTDNEYDYGIIDKCLEGGKLTKEMLTGLSGFHIGALIVEAIGEDRIYQAVVNSSNAVTTLSDSMLAYIETYKPTNSIMLMSWNALKSGICPADMYEDVVSGIAQQIKTDAKANGIISNGESRSKVLAFLIGLRLKEMYKPAN